MKTINISTHNAQKRFFMTDDELKNFFEYLENEITEQGYDFKYTTDETVDELSADFVNNLISYFYFEVLGKKIDLKTGIYPDYMIITDVLYGIIDQYNYKNHQEKLTALDKINNAVCPETDIEELNKIAQFYAFNIKDEIKILGLEKITNEHGEKATGLKSYKVQFEIGSENFFELIFLDIENNKFFVADGEASYLESNRHDLDIALFSLIDILYPDFLEDSINGIKEKLLEWTKENVSK